MGSTTTNSQYGFRGARFAFASLVALCALCVALFAIPQDAQAKSYTCPSVVIDATVQPDGSLSVVETRTFDFDGTFSAVWWNFDSMPSDECELSVASVEVASREGESADASSTESASLPEVAFERAWREEGGPSEPSYSLDEDYRTVYVFNDVSDESVDVTLCYSITNFVQVYDDVAELYWQYIGHGWSVKSSHVVATVHLPVPAGASAAAGSDVRAWAHGPLDGTLTVGNDGTISMTVPSVDAGGYAEVRATFPRQWVSGASAHAPVFHTGTRLDTVLAEEERLANQANADRIKSLLFIVVCLIVSAAVIVWALVVFFRHGREYKPEFTDTYWRDVPERGIHPAVIGRLWRWNGQSDQDFTATLMHLSCIGAIRIDAGSYEQPKSFGGMRTVNDYYITRLAGWEEKVAGSRVDKQAMDLLFERIAPGADALWFGTIAQYGSDHPEAFVNEMNEWQGVLSAEVNSYDFFEAKGERYRGIMLGVAALAVLGGLAWAWFSGNFIPLIAAAPTVVVLLVISTVMSRRSKRAVEIHAKSEALKKWLKDFSALDERLPTDVKVWGEMMVYAYLFGVAKEALNALRMRMPQIVEDEQFIPVYYWMMPHYYGAGSAASSMGSPADMFATMQSNTIATAQEAISAASGSFSSGGGMGGGFSGGGGGAR